MRHISAKKFRLERAEKTIDSFCHKHKKFVSVIYYVVIAALVLGTFSRCFDNVLWGDEAFTAHLARADISELINTTANDVHPPLYYIVAKIFIGIFGESGFVYHFASFVPYLVLIITICIFMQRKYGKLQVLLLCTLVTITPVFVRYNIEIRMYSLAALLIFMTFIAALRCYKNGTMRWYMALSLFAALAMYTHYYCIVMCAILYLVLTITNIARKKDIIKGLLSGGFACILYIPWIVTLFKTLNRTAGNWWSTEIPKIGDIITYPFASNLWLTFIMTICLVIGLSYSAKILIQKSSLKYEVDLAKFNLNEDSLGIILAITMYVGTAAIGVVVSKIIRPLFLLRYLLPTAVLLYYAIVVGVGKFKNKSVCEIFLIFLVVACMSVPAAKIFRDDWTISEKNDYTLQVLEEQISENTILASNNTMLNWTVNQYYFKENKRTVLSKDQIGAIECRDDREYVIMWSDALSETTEKLLVKNGCNIEKIIDKEQSSLGLVSFNGYVLKPAR